MNFINIKQNEAGAPVLIPDKIHFKTESFIEYRGLFQSNETIYL